MSKSSKSMEKSTSYGESDDTFFNPHCTYISLLLIGDLQAPGEKIFITIFNGQVIIDAKWHEGNTLESQMPVNLKDPKHHSLIADKPLLFFIRILGGKGAKDQDPLSNLDNRAGGNVDLFPLLLGEDEVYVKVPLVLLTSGEDTGCAVEVRARHTGISENTKVPLLLTLISAHCLPSARDGTAYIGAIGLDGVINEESVNFGMSLSTCEAKNIVWASASNGGLAANTAFSVPDEDKYVPYDFEPKCTEKCKSVYWNAIRRILVDSSLLYKRLCSPLLVEFAGVPRMGKIEVRGRYIGFIDAGVLLEPGQTGVTACTKLYLYNEAMLPENVGPLLDIPPTSAKVSAREISELLMDENGHCAYIDIRFSLVDSLVPKLKIAKLFENIGCPTPVGPVTPIEELEVVPPLDNSVIDVRRIRKEGGALEVHRELCGLACEGAVPMNQGIKRTAANRLLMRVRTMVKQFPPGDCTNVEWQDVVTSQHAASRRAVTSSFAPQAPPPREPPRVAAARSRLAGDRRVADIHIKTNLKVGPSQPRSLLSKALRCLEEGNNFDAKNYLLEGLSAQPRNRYLLWTFAGQEFDKGPQGIKAATAALRIAAKGDYSDGTSNAIGWAALHSLNHFNDNSYAGFIAAKEMRKSYELHNEWKKFLLRWIDASGEEEVFWIPGVITSFNPMLITAAFFLCLRCYKFCETLLQCVEQGCATRGCRRGNETKITVDIHYLRASSLIIRRQLDEALVIIDQGIKRFGPSSIMSQIRTSCVMSARGWDGRCENAMTEAEKAGAELCPAILLQAAIGQFKSNPKEALQRAARAHKIAPSAYSALIIGRIYAKLGEEEFAERWAAVSVKLEPLLADGWAFLAVLALYDRNVDKGRAMLRTARQVGPVSADLEEDLKTIMNLVKSETLSDSLQKNLCLCEYC